MARHNQDYDQLRTRIARIRRRIDRKASRVVDRAVQWAGWRGYVGRYPGRALAAAVGVGFALSTIASRVRWPGGFGVRLYELAVAGSWRRVWDLIRKVATGAGEAHEAEGGTE